MVSDPIYRITDLFPRTDLDVGRYQPKIYLDRDFAQRALNLKITPEIQQRFQKIGKEKIKTLSLRDPRIMLPPYIFIDNSLLIKSVRVPGDACNLSTEWSFIENIKRNSGYIPELMYGPHNVDSSTQSYSLIGLFATWVDFAEAHLHHTNNQ